jgi:hypothetical protein
MKLSFFALGALFCLLLAGNGYCQVDRSEEVKSFMAGLSSGSSSQRINTAKRITRSGVVDKDLYDKVAKLLKEGYMDAYESNHVDEMSWLCKALASSGDPQYKALLTEVAENATDSKLQYYARQSIGLIAEYGDRSRTLNSNILLNSEFNNEENRLAHMLKSEIVAMKRDAAKIIVRSSIIHNDVYHIAAAELENMLTAGSQSEHIYIDTMGWLCKALAASGNPEFVPTLQKVVDGAEDIKLKNHASKSLKDID